MRKFFVLMCVFAIGCSSTREEMDAKQKAHQPVLVSEANGVRLYSVYDVRCNQTVYFTTPSGSTQWVIPGNEDHGPIRKGVVGNQ